MTDRKRCRVCKKSWAAPNRAECRACRRRAEQEQRAAEPRRTCRACGQEKRVSGFYQWRDSRSGAPRIDLDCRACKRKRVRERYAEMMADPYLAARERKRKLDWNNAHSVNPGRCKRYRERLKRERPEVYQQQLEDARIRARLRKDLLGAKNGPRVVVVHEPKSRPSLPVEPLVGFLSLIPEDAINALHPSSQRAIRRLSEDPEGVSPLVADRIVTACGGALSLVYPELYA